MHDEPPPTRPTSRADRVIVSAAAVFHLGIAVFPLSASGLLTPTWFLVVVAVGWLAGAVILVRLARSHPRRTWAVPLVVLAGWFVLVTLGGQVLGWTA